MPRAIAAVAAAGVLAGGGYLYATPFISINQFREAIEARDVPAIEQHVDFPAVRSSLKDQLKVKLTEGINAESNGDPFVNFGLNALGSTFGEPIINAAVDSYISPAGLKTLFQGSTSDASTTDSVNISNTGNASDNNSQITLEYKSPSLFVVSSKDAKSAQSAKLYFERRDLIRWKLISVSLP